MTSDSQSGRLLLRFKRGLFCDAVLSVVPVFTTANVLSPFFIADRLV